MATVINQLPLVVLHGAYGIWDEVLFFGGMGLLLLLLVLYPFLTGRHRRRRGEEDEQPEE